MYLHQVRTRLPHTMLSRSVVLGHAQAKSSIWTRAYGNRSTKPKVSCTSSKTSCWDTWSTFKAYLQRLTKLRANLIENIWCSCFYLCLQNVKCSIQIPRKQFVLAIIILQQHIALKMFSVAYVMKDLKIAVPLLSDNDTNYYYFVGEAN